MMRVIFALCSALMLFCHQAHATDQLDLSTGLKTLLLMNNKITGAANLAIVFDAAIPESKQDAEAIKGDIDSGSGIPSGIKMTAELIEIAQIQKISGSQVVFLAKGVPSGSFESINRAAVASGALTVSTDLECVKANKCVLGVVSKPRVEIYYSQMAAEAAHINFAPAFLMLVKQI